MNGVCVIAYSFIRLFCAGCLCAAGTVLVTRGLAVT